MSASTSRKRSAASSQSRPHKPPTYFLDRSLGRFKLATALRQAGLLVEVHNDHFQQDATDEEWLTGVGQRGWVVLTKDEKIRYHAQELRALVSRGVRAFVLTARNVNADEMASIVLGARTKIERFLAKHAGPFMVTISRGGTLAVLWPESGRKKASR